MENKIEEFKKYVAEQLIDYDDFREASADGYVNDITDKAVKLFAMPVVSNNEVVVCSSCGMQITKDVYCLCENCIDR